MYTIKKALLWFLDKINGKKATIVAIIGALITFGVTKGYIDIDLAQLLSAILVALGLGANISNAKLTK